MSDNILKKEYKVPSSPQISKDSKDVLMKCLVKDEKKRITIKQLKDHPLFVDIIDDVNELVNKVYGPKNNFPN